MALSQELNPVLRELQHRRLRTTETARLQRFRAPRLQRSTGVVHDGPACPSLLRYRALVLGRIARGWRDSHRERDDTSCAAEARVAVKGRDNRNPSQLLVAEASGIVRAAAVEIGAPETAAGEIPLSAHSVLATEPLTMASSEGRALRSASRAEAARLQSSSSARSATGAELESLAVALMHGLVPCKLAVRGVKNTCEAAQADTF
eukprot:scaffold157558_cov35-Tisochrysis_lutea.AAC.4